MSYRQKVRIGVSYFPELASHQACNRHAAGSSGCTELHDKLRETGYRLEQRIFTPRQVGLITSTTSENRKLVDR